MMVKEETLTFSATSPAAASTVVSSSIKGVDLARASKIVVDATLTQATGGTLDVYVQCKLAADTWADVIHFPQIAAGVAVFRYTATLNGEGTALVVVGGGTDAAPGVALAANTVVNRLVGTELRVVFVAGVSTSAGAVQTIRFTPYLERG